MDCNRPALTSRPFLLNNLDITIFFYAMLIPLIALINWQLHLKPF